LSVVVVVVVKKVIILEMIVSLVKMIASMMKQTQQRCDFAPHPRFALPPPLADWPKPPEGHTSHTPCAGTLAHWSALRRVALGCTCQNLLYGVFILFCCAHLGVLGAVTCLKKGAWGKVYGVPHKYKRAQKSKRKKVGKKPDNSDGDGDDDEITDFTPDGHREEKKDISPPPNTSLHPGHGTP